MTPSQTPQANSEQNRRPVGFTCTLRRCYRNPTNPQPSPQHAPPAFDTNQTTAPSSSSTTLGPSPSSTSPNNPPRPDPNLFRQRIEQLYALMPADALSQFRTSPPHQQPSLSTAPQPSTAWMFNYHASHEKSPRRKTVFVAGAPGTQAARHEQISLLMQRNPFGREVELRCVYAAPLRVAAKEEGQDAGYGVEGGEDTAASGESERDREWWEKRRVETLRAAVREACGADTPSGGEGTGVGVLDDAASVRSGVSSHSAQRSEKTVVVLVDGFPSTLSETRLFESVVGKPDCVVVFTGETAFLKKNLRKELQAKGRARERAKSFGHVASGSGTVAGGGGVRRRAVSEALASSRPAWAQSAAMRRGEHKGKGELGIAQEVAVEDEAEGGGEGHIEKEVEKQLADGWYKPLLEVSSRYAVGLGPRMVAELDVQKGKEALYVEVVRVLQRVNEETGN